jgi:hypothetical protein
LPPKDLTEKIAIVQEAVAEAKVPAQRARRKTVEADAPTPEPTGKAAKYAALLNQAGWEASVVGSNGMMELTATRGIEAIFLSWFNEAHISGGSTYTYADRTIKVRNPAEAMRLAARTFVEASEAQLKVSSNKMFRRRETGPQRRSVPFDPATATDMEIINALEARVVTWHNQYRVDSETAKVGNARAIRIDNHTDGHRIVSFVDPESGFRAFRLDMLENVGRRINLERIRQEILSSLTRGERASKKAKVA